MKVAAADNGRARARLAQLASALRNFPKEAAPRAAKRGAEVLKQVIERNVAAGVGPDGDPWPLRQDGAKALADAAAEVQVTAYGTTILARLEGPYALHHFGRARGRVVRQILPTKKAPQPMVEAVEASMAEDYRELLR